MINALTWRLWPGMQTEVDPAKIGEEARVFQNLMTGAGGAHAETRAGWETALEGLMDAGWVYHAPFGERNGMVIAATRGDDGRVDNGIYYSPDKPRLVEAPFEPAPLTPDVPTPALVAWNLNQAWVLDLEAQTFETTAVADISAVDSDAVKAIGMSVGGKTVYLADGGHEVRLFTTAGWSAGLALTGGAAGPHYIGFARLADGRIAVGLNKPTSGALLKIVDVSGADPVLDETVDISAAIAPDLSINGVVGYQDQVCAFGDNGRATMIDLSDGSQVWQANLQTAVDAVYNTETGGASIFQVHPNGGGPVAAVASTFARIYVLCGHPEANANADAMTMLCALEASSGAVAQVIWIPALLIGDSNAAMQIAAGGGRVFVFDGADNIYVFEEVRGGDDALAYEGWIRPFDLARHTEAGSEDSTPAPATIDDYINVSVQLEEKKVAYALFWTPENAKLNLLDCWSDWKYTAANPPEPPRWRRWNADGTGEETVFLTGHPLFTHLSDQYDNAADEPFDGDGLPPHDLSLQGTVI